MKSPTICPSALRILMIPEKQERIKRWNELMNSIEKALGRKLRMKEIEYDYDCDPSGMGCDHCARFMDDCDGNENLMSEKLKKEILGDDYELE